jgi:formyltetrahydrofolate-dependent phosphoribosylglycinamide formyltransferase
MKESFRVAVLASGGGSNFQSLLDRLHASTKSPVEVVLLVASKPGIYAIERAAAVNVPTVVLPAPSEGREAAGKRLSDALDDARPDLIVLAGYLRLIPEEVVRAYWGRMINIHPALLPAFGGEGMYGGRVHSAVLERGARVSGVTVHFVDEAYDHGPIIAQWPVPVLDDDTPDVLAGRVLRVEHALLPAVVDAIARGQVKLLPTGECRWHAPWPGGDRFMIVPAAESEGNMGPEEWLASQLGIGG